MLFLGAAHHSPGRSMTCTDARVQKHALPCTMQAGRRPLLGALAGLRFLAALHVMLMHRAQPYLGWAPTWAKSVVAAGYTSVSLFFVLSGFILAYTYLEPGTPNPVNRRAFWIARVSRVYPVYLLALLAAFPSFLGLVLARNGQMLGPSTSPLKIAVASLGLAQAWSWTTVWQWNSPGWSLSVEAFFYLIFPFVAIPLVRAARGREIRASALLWALALLPPVVYLLLNPEGIGAGLPSSRDPILLTVKFNPLFRLPEFLLGIVLGKLFLDRASSGPAVTAHRDWMSGSAGGLLVVVLAASPILPYVLLHNSLLTPLFALLVFGLATGRSGLARLLSRPTMVRLGEASYALYLLHQPIWWWMTTVAGVNALDRQPDRFFLGYCGITLAASVLIYEVVERPARRAIRSAFLRPTPA